MSDCTLDGGPEIDQEAVNFHCSFTVKNEPYRNLGEPPGFFMPTGVRLNRLLFMYDWLWRAFAERGMEIKKLRNQLAEMRKNERL